MGELHDGTNSIQLQLAKIRTNLTKVQLPGMLFTSYMYVFFQLFFVILGPSNFVPHLNHHSKLEPSVHLGNLSPNLEFLIGIPTVKRDVQSYLMDTLKSLFNGVSKTDSFGIIIYVGELDESYVTQIVLDVAAAFPKEYEDGKIEIISPPQYYYPKFELEIEKLINDANFFNTFGDNPERIKWRQKQNLGIFFDFLFFENFKIIFQTMHFYGCGAI